MKATGNRGKTSRPKRGKAEKPAHGTKDLPKSSASSQRGLEPAMVKAEPRMKIEATPRAASKAGAGPAIGAAEALSFLKETKGEVNWTAKKMAASLRISSKEAVQALALLQIQGYVKAAGANEWLTTPEGEAVSGAKPPRFARESLEQALAALTERITEFNRDGGQEFKVTEAVAFGDFLSERAQVQAADVGVQLSRRKGQRRTEDADVSAPESAVEQAGRNTALRKLRGRTALLHLRPYEAWMSHRTHRKLL